MGLEAVPNERVAPRIFPEAVLERGEGSGQGAKR